MAKVFVGMSGGVDSSVTAALLKDQGHDVTGVFMKNWTRDIGGVVCPWRRDLADAKRVAVQLDIPLKIFDFEKQYKHKVVDYMLDELERSRTPNPDVMCNQEVKFKLFLNTALEQGADMIATGHYARLKPLAASPAGPAKPATPRSSRLSAVSEPAVLTQRTNQYASLSSSAHSSVPSEPMPSRVRIGLHKGIDKNKDQSYFLYRVTEKALSKTLMPIGELRKPEVRRLAKQYGLATADKPDSQGICFVGEVSIDNFIREFIEVKSGVIIERTSGRELGRHKGAPLYTVGQRHGLGLGGGLPYYVIGTDVKTNTVTVTTDLDDESLWRDKFAMDDIRWVNGQPDWSKTYGVMVRYRSDPVPAKLSPAGDSVMVELAKETRAVTPGQSAVVYDGDTVLGGGIIQG